MRRNKFSMAHQWITAFRIGELLPVMIQEVTPGDVWYGNSTGIFRLAPLDAPAFMSLKIYAHTFFVPHSQTFPEFEDVITGEDTTTPWPTITYSFADFAKWQDFGVGASTVNTPEINAMPVRAFNHVINKYFNNPEHYSERGLDEIGVYRVNFPENSYHGAINTEKQQGGTETVSVVGGILDMANTRDGLNNQRIKERRALYGERYRDMVYADYGIKLPTFNEDRPLHVARGKTTMGISEVVATATSTTEETGEIRGHGISAMRMSMRPRMFSEHGTLITVAYARPRLQLRYKHDHIWCIDDKDELHNVSTETQSQQLINSREVWSNAGAAYTNFGYLPKHEWLRKPVDVIAGALQQSGNEKWLSFLNLSSTPTVAYLQQVQDYDHLFQDTGATRTDIQCMFSHKLMKRSFIKKAPRRV